MHLSTQRTPLDTPRVAGAGGGADMAHRADRGPGRQGRACGHRPWRWAAVGWPGVRTGGVGTGSAGSGRPTTPQPYRCVVACFSGQKVKAEETHCVCLRGDGGQGPSSRRECPRATQGGKRTWEGQVALRTPTWLEGACHLRPRTEPGHLQGRAGEARWQWRPAGNETEGFQDHRVIGRAPGVRPAGDWGGLSTGDLGRRKWGPSPPSAPPSSHFLPSPFPAPSLPQTGVQG